MKYVLTGSLGNITKPLAEKLVKAGHHVTIISSHPERKENIERSGATAAIGTVEDASFLERTFTGADAVYTMIPPTFKAANWKAFIHNTGKIYADAIQSSGVRKVVNLSSIGAHMPDGCGPVSGLYYAEQELNKVVHADIKHLRPAFFYTNFLNSIGMIKSAGFLGNNYGGDTKLVMTHPHDIATVAAKELSSLDFTGKSIQYIASDERSVYEITSIIGAAISKPDLRYVEFSDEETLKGGMQAGLPEDIARNFMEMGQAIRSGEMIADYRKYKVVPGKTKLEDFARDFAVAYKNS